MRLDRLSTHARVNDSPLGTVRFGAIASVFVLSMIVSLPASAQAQNHVPVVDAISDVSDAEGDQASIGVIASDPDGDPLTYTASVLPSGITIGQTTGAIAGTVGYDAAGVRTVTVTVSDGALTASRTFTWTVANTNRVPTLQNPGDRWTTADYEESFQLVASDPDNDSLTYSGTGLPPDVAISATTGYIVGTPSEAAAGTYTVVMTVADAGGLYAQQTFSWTVVATAPAQVSLVSPTTSTATRTPALVWNAQHGANYYLVRVIERTGTTDNWYTPAAAGCSLGTGTCTATLAHNLDVGQVSWEVLAWNPFGYGPWSQTTGFIVEIVDATAAQATAQDPVGVLDSESVPFHWSRVANAVWYRVWRRDGANIELERWFQPADAGCATIDPCEGTITPYLADGSGEWKVQAWTNTGSGPWSTTKSFVVSLIVPATPITGTPQTTITDQTPTFTWPATAHAWYYLLRVYVGEDYTDRWYTPAQAGCAPGASMACSVRPVQTLSAGLVDWQLIAWNQAGYSPWSSVATFRVATASPSQVTLVSPAADATTHSVPTFVWQASTNATYYLLQISDSDGTTYDRWFKPEQAGCPVGDGNCSASPLTLRGGPATWKVIPYNPIAYGPWSVTRSFIACTMQLTPPSVMAISGGQSGTIEIAVDPACAWTASSSASWLHVTGGGSGSGAGSIAYTVDANTATQPRSATLTIEDAVVTVTQQQVCTYTLSLTGQTFLADGGTITIAVSAPTGCAWSVSSPNSWISIVSNASGSGNGTVQYVVASNASSSPRSGTVVIANATHAVSQAGAPDTTAPTVTSVTPSSAANGVSPTSSVAVSFSESLASSTVTGSTFVLTDPANNAIGVSVAYNDAVHMATLTPSAPLSERFTYTATVKGGATGIKDVAGNALAADYIWSFTTADVTPPSVTSVTPSDGATGMPASTDVLVSFSEDLTSASVTTATFELRDEAGFAVPASVNYSSATHAATLHPSSPIGTGTYTVFVKGGWSGVKDLALRTLPSDFTSSFTSTNASAPTITATFSPAPNGAGWYSSNVTASFTCTDGDGISLCSHSIQITSEGAGIPVTGTATDTMGNSTTKTWYVNIDKTAPIAHIYYPTGGSNLSAGTTSVTLRGGAVDVSGIDLVSCAGTPATLTGNQFTCTVSVAPGGNTVTVEAYDLAGRMASTTVTFTVGDPTVTSLEISPGTMVMFAGDSRELYVKDQSGNDVHQGAWTVSDSSIATVTETGGVTTLSAVAAGTATLSVTYSAHTAQATVTVYPAGVDLPPGTTLWSLNDSSGLGAPKRGKVLRAVSSGSDPDLTKAPALIFVDEGTEWNLDKLTRFFDRPTRIRTTSADGRQLSNLSFGGRVPQQIAADNDGGFIVVLPPSNVPFLPSTLQRFDGRTGLLSWEYVAAEGFLTDAAIHPDGTIYISEYHILGTSFLVKISPTGGTTRYALPQGRFVQVDSGTCGRDKGVKTSAYVSHPIIRDDGTAVMLAHVNDTFKQISSSPVNEVICSERFVAGADNASAFLIEVSDTGMAVHDLNITSSDIPSQVLDQYQLLPDGHGGLLIADRKRPSVWRIDDNYRVAAKNNAFVTDSSRYYETEYVLGEDGAYAVVNSYVTFTTPNPYRSRVLSFDPQTLQVIDPFTDLGTPKPVPQHIRLKFALSGAGVYAVGPTSAYVVNATVDASGFAAGGNATSLINEFWAGWSGAPAFAIGSNVNLATTLWAQAGGVQGRNESNPMVYGIFFKGHHVPNSGFARHASIRITPRNQDLWLSLKPQAFFHLELGVLRPNLDERGHYFATLGAGPGTNHVRLADASGADCTSYFLTNAVSFSTDRTAPAENFEPLQYNLSGEDTKIASLFQLDDNYRDNLPYCADPNLLGPAYNSNSYINGLLRAASVPTPMAVQNTNRYVGWTKPVPPAEFSSH